MVLVLEQLVIVQGDFRLEADLSVAKSVRVGLIGPSGAGKSTLLSVVAGFFPAESGRVFWDGTDISDLPPGKRPLSILFQDQNLFPHLTVAQNVGLGLRPDLRLSADQTDKVARALSRVGLPGLEARKPAELSGGQQSRVALARALLQSRPLMLLDEPFSALGPALKSEMLDLVAEIADETGATVLMVTHEPNDARLFAGQTIVVADGVAQPPRPTADVLDNPSASLAAYLGRS